MTNILGSTYNTISVSNTSDCLESAIDELESIVTDDPKKVEKFNRNVLPTGVKHLDYLLNGGFLNGTLNVISSKAGMPKHGFFRQQILNALYTLQAIPKQSGELSFEETKPIVILGDAPKADFTNALLSTISEIPWATLRGGYLTDKDWEDLSKAIEVFKECPFYYIESYSAISSELSEEVKKIAEKHNGLTMIAVDHIEGIIELETNGNLHTFLSDLKSLAKEYNCPALLTAPLNSKREIPAGETPRLFDIFGGSYLKNIPDLILFATAWDERDEDGFVSFKSEGESEEGYYKKVNIVVKKNDYGRTGFTTLGYNPKCQKFEHCLFDINQ